MNDAAPLPADLSAVRCGDAAGWWFHLACTAPGCSACISYPMRLLLKQQRCAAVPLLDVARRFRCKRCGAKPSTLVLTERADRMPGTMCGGGSFAKVIDLLPLLPPETRPVNGLAACYSIPLVRQP